MQELEKILEEMDNCIKEVREKTKGYEDFEAFRLYESVMNLAKTIVLKYATDRWIPVDEKPKKDYETVFAVDKNDYYFAAVYDKDHGFRSNDIGADVDNIVAYSLFNPYRPERSYNHDRERSD